MIIKRIQRALMLLVGTNLEPPIGSRLLIIVTMALIISVPTVLVRIYVMNVSGLVLIGVLLLYPATIFIIGPIIGFPIYFIHELLRHSRLPNFPRQRFIYLTMTMLIVLVLFWLFSVQNINSTSLIQNINSMLLVTGIVHTRLMHPRSPWPRIFYIYSPGWLKQALIGTIGTFLVGAIMGLPNVLVKLASLLVPSLLLSWKLYELTRVYRGDNLRLPNRCVLLLRPFGFDDENFAELNRGFFSILDPSYGAPFDTFVRSSVEKQLGAFISFGDPGDIALRRGARRYYIADTYWRTAFKELVSKTVAFLAVVPTTNESFIWELARLRELDVHTRLFLFTPPIHKPRKKPFLVRAYERMSLVLLPRREVPNTKDSWQHAALNFSPIGYQLTEYPGPGSVIGFDADGTNIVLARNCEEPWEFIAPVRDRLYSTD